MANHHDNINVSLPQPMLAWVEAQVAAGRYGNVSEYVRDLIRRDQEDQTDQELEEVLLRSVASIERGEGIEVTPEFWEKERQALVARAEARANARAKEGS